MDKLWAGCFRSCGRRPFNQLFEWAGILFLANVRDTTWLLLNGLFSMAILAWTGFAAQRRLRQFSLEGTEGRNLKATPYRQPLPIT